MLDEEPEATDDPLSKLHRQEAGQAVTDALAELDVPTRQAICLAFYDGLTHVEIADHLQIPLGTAKTRIRLGMAKLQFRLKSTWEGAN